MSFILCSERSPWPLLLEYEYFGSLLCFAVSRVGCVVDMARANNVDSLGNVHTEPFTEPHYIKIMIPCKGKDEEVGKFEIRNPTQQKITFKIRGTKITEFSTVDPSCGYIPANCQVTVSCQPKVISSIAGWTKLDKFTVLTAPAPDGDADPAALWKTLQPKQTLGVHIKICDATHPDGL